MEARHKEDRETRSLVPSRMKRKTKIEVSNDGTLKPKRRTIVITGQGKNRVEKQRVNDEEVVEAVMPHAVTIGKKCLNNVAEYQDLIIGLQMELELGIPSLAVSGDSKLVIIQLLREYEVHNEDLVPYFCYAIILINKFDSVELEHVPREENRMADALANLATTLALQVDNKVYIPVCQQRVLPELLDRRIEETDAILVRVVEAEDWRQPLVNYLEHGRLPEDIRHKTEIRRTAPRFIYYKDTLIFRSYEGLFLC
ncbi:hypothetical protein RJ640_000195 [Escallonia rubra]|uniref:RNase H type-1 domain-containing protein n=1 Tax=Escallonia rubra TaxID=112253 RepID=A0AA88UGM7_9ASTE|nr:hypothetical protein RJ640_000195 [Escallonia rubra]